MNGGLKRRGFLGGIMAAIGAMFVAKTSRGGTQERVVERFPRETLLDAFEKAFGKEYDVPEGFVELRVYRFLRIDDIPLTVVGSGYFPPDAIEKYDRLLREDEYRQGWFMRSKIHGRTRDEQDAILSSLPMLASNGYWEGANAFEEWRKCRHSAEVLRRMFAAEDARREAIATNA